MTGGAGPASAIFAAQRSAVPTSSEEHRRAIAISVLKPPDHGGTSPTTDLGLFVRFAEDAEVCFQKWAHARGKPQIMSMFTDVGGKLKTITHHYDGLTSYTTGTDRFAVERASNGAHRDGPWQAEAPMWMAGRWCDCFEVKNGKITRLFNHLDPDHAGMDTDRYSRITP